ncbi:MAG: hypothetical protein AAFZ01_07825 [Pseudomonadota bacterium]
MIKNVLITGVFTAAFAGAAFAADTPRSAAECDALVKKTVALFDNKTLSDAQEDKLEALFDSLDNQCASNSYEDAAKTAGEIADLVPDA